jgi:hypothetical protein
MAQELQTREYKYSIAVRIKDCDPFCVLLSMDEAQRLLAVGEVSHQLSILHCRR